MRTSPVYEFNEDSIDELGDIQKMIKTCEIWDDIYTFFPVS